MTGYLIETLVWTGILIALVLLVRRPVAQILGAGAAYTLWLLPVARLVLPPLVLPAWLAPEREQALAPMEAPAPAMVDGTALWSVSSPGMATSAPMIGWTDLLIGIWLIGAAVFLARRYSLYFRMRRAILAESRPMGEAGPIRLVETPHTDGPIAFGVFDKVVALPTGFMASHDIHSRDLALAHEIAHHHGRDLLFNMLVQPLFAIHWFNPLAGIGWQALRRDQEAACDARVVGQAPREVRAAYAAVIARFATRSRGPSRLALAAPMACPVLGDHSIVHRLRSLAMTELSSRRRWAGRLLAMAGALALPLTASISYAQNDAAPPSPPSPPAPPASAVAPPPPALPSSPEIPDASEAWTEGTAPRGENTRVIRIERRAEPGKPVQEKRIVISEGADLSPETRKMIENGLADAEKEIAKGVRTHRQVQIAIADAASAAPKVTVNCRDNQKEVAETVTNKDGQLETMVCTAIARAEARQAIAAARREIAQSKELSDKARAEAQRALDEAARVHKDTAPGQ